MHEQRVSFQLAPFLEFGNKRMDVAAFDYRASGVKYYTKWTLLHLTQKHSTNNPTIKSTPCLSLK